VNCVSVGAVFRENAADFQQSIWSLFSFDERHAKSTATAATAKTTTLDGGQKANKGKGHPGMGT
jgi:hypothetical protein